MNLSRQNKIVMSLCLIVAVLLITTIRGCSYRDQLRSKLSDAYGANMRMTVQALADSSTIYSVRAQFVELEDELLKAESELMKLRNTQSIVKVRIKTTLHDTIYIDKPVVIDSVAYLKLPAPIQKHQKWYSFEGKLTESGYLSIDTLSIDAGLSIGIGDTMRSGLFNRIMGKSDPVVRLHIDNPYIEATGLTSIVAKPKKHRWWVPVGAGIIGGVLIGTQIK